MIRGTRAYRKPCTRRLSLRSDADARSSSVEYNAGRRAITKHFSDAYSAGRRAISDTYNAARRANTTREENAAAYMIYARKKLNGKHQKMVLESRSWVELVRTLIIISLEHDHLDDTPEEHLNDMSKEHLNVDESVVKK